MSQGGLLSLLGIDPRDKRDQRNREAEIDAQSRGQLAVENARQQGMMNIAKINNDATLTLAEKNRLTQLELEKLKHVQATQMVGTTGDDQRKTIGVTGSENRLGIQATGEQTRMTDRAKGKSDQRLERVRASEGRRTDDRKSFNTIAEANAAAANKTKELERMQALGVAGANNFISAPVTENERVFSGATMDPMLQGKQQELMEANRVRATPGFQRTFEQGMNANNLKPVFDNLQKGSMTVAPGAMGIFPPSGSAAPPTDMNRWNQAQGSAIDESMQTSNFVTKDGTSIPLSSEVVRKNIPGRVRVAPNILQQAGQLPPGVQAAPPSAAFNPAMNPEMQAILRQILQSQGQ